MSNTCMHRQHFFLGMATSFKLHLVIEFHKNISQVSASARHYLGYYGRNGYLYVCYIVIYLRSFNFGYTVVEKIGYIFYPVSNLFYIYLQVFTLAVYFLLLQFYHRYLYSIYGHIKFYLTSYNFVPMESF